MRANSPGALGLQSECFVCVFMMKAHQFLLVPRLRLPRPVRATNQRSATGC